MIWLDKLLSHTALVKAKNKQLQQYSDQIDYLIKLLFDTDVNIEGIDYAKIAQRKARLCHEFFTQLKEKEKENEKLEIEIMSLKHMLDRYEEDLDKLRKE